VKRPPAWKRKNLLKAEKQVAKARARKKLQKAKPKVEGEKKPETKAPRKRPVPETILKRRARVKKVKKLRRIIHDRVAKDLKTKRKLAFKRAEKYLKEYREREKWLIKQKRIARTKGNFFVEPEAKLAFVVRIRGINGVSPKTRKILQLLRLRQIHNAVFVKLNKATINMLRRVEPYIAYGYPNLRSVKELVYKRGFAKVNKQRVAITSNHIIDKALGRKGLICMEDLIHEIYTVGKHFKFANKFLWSFKLHPPRGGLRAKGKHFVEGGDYGNREELINKLIHRMI